jgi:hypothetical protein
VGGVLVAKVVAVECEEIVEPQVEGSLGLGV